VIIDFGEIQAANYYSRIPNDYTPVAWIGTKEEGKAHMHEQQQES
jgi:hypothetical protein